MNVLDYILISYILLMVLFLCVVDDVMCFQCVFLKLKSGYSL